MARACAGNEFASSSNSATVSPASSAASARYESTSFATLARAAPLLTAAPPSSLFPANLRTSLSTRPTSRSVPQVWLKAGIISSSSDASSSCAAARASSSRTHDAAAPTMLAVRSSVSKTSQETERFSVGRMEARVSMKKRFLSQAAVGLSGEGSPAARQESSGSQREE